MHQATHPQQKSIHHPVLVKGLAMLAAATCALAGGLICTQPALAQEISATDTSDSATTTPIDSNSDKQSTAGLISHAAAREQKNAGIDAYSAFPDNWQMSSGMPSAGNAHVLVLRVDFPDMHFDSDDTLEALQADIDGSAGTAPFESLKAFYGRSSYGKLHIDGKAYGYTASKPRSSYTDDTRSLFYEALHALDDQIDYSQFDGNNDGKIDAVYIHFAGPDTGWGSAWWSNESIADSPGHADDRFDGKQLWNTILISEKATQAVTTMCHETGHALGLPDYYPYGKAAGGYYNKGGIGTFAMMESNTSDFTGFSKWLLGWMDDDLITRAVVSSDGVTWKKGLADAEHHAATLDMALSALSTDEMKDHGGFVVISNDRTLLTASGIFSSYYLVQYDAVAGAQTCGNIAKKAPGFRVFRIQAELNDSNDDFQHSTSSGEWTDQLIESVTGPVDRANPFFVTGDHLSPSTIPSTNFHENIASGYTGIDLTVLDSKATSGSIRIGFTAKPTVNFTIKDDVMPGKLANIGRYRLSTSIGVQITDDSEAKLVIDGKSYKASVQAKPGMKQLSISGISIQAGTIGPKSDCEFVFPAGMFIIDTDQNGNPVYSKEIHVPVHPTLLASIDFAGDYDFPEGTNISNVASIDGNGSYYATVSNGSLTIHKVDTTDYSKTDGTQVRGISFGGDDIVMPQTVPYDVNHIFIILTVNWAERRFLIVDTRNGSVTAQTTTPMETDSTNDHYLRIGHSLLLQNKRMTGVTTAYMQTLITPKGDGTFSARRTMRQYYPLQTTSDGQVYTVKDDADGNQDVRFYDGNEVERQLIEVGTPIDDQSAIASIDDSFFDALNPTRTLHVKGMVQVAAVDTNADVKDTRYAIYAQQWQTLPSGEVRFVWHIQTFDAKGNVTSDTVDSSELITPDDSSVGTKEALLRISPTGAVAITRLDDASVYDTLFLDNNHDKLSMLCDWTSDWGDWVDGRWMSIGTDIDQSDTVHRHYTVTSRFGNPSSPGTEDDPSEPAEPAKPADSGNVSSKQSTSDAAQTGTHTPIVIANTGSAVMIRWVIALCAAAVTLMLVVEYTRHAER